MTVFKRLLGYPLLGLGGLLVLAMVLAPLSALSSEQDKAATRAGGLVIGLPLSAVGGSLVLSANSQERRQLAAEQEQVRLQQVLYQLLTETDGQVTLVQFAIAANIPAEAARAYIDSQAAAFGASFGVSEIGSVIYQFPVS